MELALLSAVPGLDGSPVDTDRWIGNGLAESGAAEDGMLGLKFRGDESPAGEGDRLDGLGGGARVGAEPDVGKLFANGGPALVELADRLGGAGPLGGGGVELAVVVAPLGSFLLTHLFSSLS